MASAYRLSRNFFTTKYNQTTTNSGAKVKSGIALMLGIIPFGLTKLGMICFRSSAQLGNKFPSISKLIGIPGLFFGGTMILSSVLFSYSQKMVWGKYVPYPSGDTSNSRLAQYGSGDQPLKDLKTLCKVFFSPESLSNDEWTLDEWKEITI